MSVVIVIPARLQSSRLPRKLLAPLGPKPLLWWTWQKALQSALADQVIIATDSSEIFQQMESFGAECIFTSERCRTGTERVYEAIQHSPQAQIIVNLQGDEPLLPLEILDGSIQTFQRQAAAQLVTAAVPFISPEQQNDPGNVKVVCNRDRQALYFSRANLAGAYLHLGLYIYSRSTLERFCQLPPSPLEQAERLEQLRALEAHIPIHLFIGQANQQHFGIDTAEDLAQAQKLIASLSLGEN